MANKIPLNAPETNPGSAQVIPTRGAHEQIYLTGEQERGAVYLGWIYYEPEYGGNAKVYRPFEPMDADGVREMFGEGNTSSVPLKAS